MSLHQILDPLSTLASRALAFDSASCLSISGCISAAGSGLYTVSGLSRHVCIGDRVALEGRLFGEVIRIDARDILVKPFAHTFSVPIGSRVSKAPSSDLRPCAGWKGRILDALGRPLDTLGPLATGPRIASLDATPPPALARLPVRTPLRTGVRAVDLFTPLCKGQRIGIFAGSGVGKSTLLAMLAKASGFDTIVIALVGERGREVRSFLEETLGKAQETAILIVSTGDETPIMRRQAPRTAMAIAEYFRDLGETVLLIADSITRFAQASREVALAAGEAPVARGFPPSVFTDLPRLLERAGPGVTGSITGVFSVLVDGDDHNDPVADAVRGTLDGHIVLERTIAAEGRFPAIDLLRSISRLEQHCRTSDQTTLIGKLRVMIARYEETRDLRLMGGYQAGSDPGLDQALVLVPKLYGALSQSPDTAPSVDAFRELADILHPKV